MKLDLTNSGIFAHSVISPDDLSWLEPDDIADNGLHDSYGRQEQLDDDEPLLSCDYSDAVDRYFQQAYGARRLQYRREAW